MCTYCEAVTSMSRVSTPVGVADMVGVSLYEEVLSLVVVKLLKVREPPVTVTLQQYNRGEEAAVRQ